MRNVMLLFALTLLSTSCSASELSFYGFTIGESLSSSKDNIKDREIHFVDSEANAKIVAGRRSSFEAMQYDSRCVQDRANELGTVACSFSSGEVESLALFYLNDSLVRIVARFRKGEEAKIMQMLAEKFPGNQLDAGEEFIQKMREMLASNLNLAAMLTAPFALKNRCDSCRVTIFVQKNKSDGVFLMKDHDGLYLTVFSVDRLSDEIERFEKRSQKKSNTSF